MAAFIVGNGPTLKSTDLDLIAGKPSYACNRINLIYPLTSWRPTVYSHIESVAPNLPFIQENVDSGIRCYLGEHFQPMIKDAENIHWIKECHHHLVNFDNADLPDEWHLPQPCSFGGSVNYNMQLAVMDGHTELVLIGCDLLYRDNFPSHFDKKYEWGGEQPAFYAAKNALFGHIQAQNYIRRRKLNIAVLNATDGGSLEIWPRMDLKDICAASG